ncbi:acylneuraminate cytidylyltransferase [Shewanella denitrificans OS217]|uniref:Acylneuraminate cytidylyltransferase n=1 Tax=Shewanella denitrificans (strain OS217 / ATCC BAA-1090 / DSM 15013) TaxID=318161 RepID=Q12JI7_SHEDO|nr:glycosyltransferase family protein [Shewanella denitrificans]ABE56389.1 acylneuraminate cytidylyltransferase [Shewanella denitrificans OS217]
MKVICITQARMGSSRLPGKVLKIIGTRPMLEYHVRRVAKSKLINHHIIATSNQENDLPIVEYCQQNNIDYYRGNETDVLGRFYETALSVHAEPDDIIIRLTGDCPLICPQLIDDAIKLQFSGESQQYTHVSLAYFPRGFDVEVFRMRSLSEAYFKALAPAQREHVTLYLYSKPDALIVPVTLHGNPSWSHFRLCVDEQDDFLLVEQLICRLGEQWLDAGPRQICELLEGNPQLVTINAHIHQRTAH